MSEKNQKNDYHCDKKKWQTVAKHKVGKHFSLLQKAILDLEKLKCNWDLRIKMTEEEDAEFTPQNENL